MTWSQQQCLNSIVMLPLILLVFSIVHTEDELNVEHQNEANFPIGWFCIVWVWTQLKLIPVCGFVTIELPSFLENLRSPYSFFNDCDHSQYPCSAGHQFPLCRNFFFKWVIQSSVKREWSWPSGTKITGERQAVWSDTLHFSRKPGWKTEMSSTDILGFIPTREECIPVQLLLVGPFTVKAIFMCWEYL